jgi:hypothetical protein
MDMHNYNTKISIYLNMFTSFEIDAAQTLHTSWAAYFFQDTLFMGFLTLSPDAKIPVFFTIFNSGESAEWDRATRLPHNPTGLQMSQPISNPSSRCKHTLTFHRLFEDHPLRRWRRTRSRNRR